MAIKLICTKIGIKGKTKKYLQFVKMFGEISGNQILFKEPVLPQPNQRVFCN